MASILKGLFYFDTIVYAGVTEVGDRSTFKITAVFEALLPLKMSQRWVWNHSVSCHLQSNFSANFRQIVAIYKQNLNKTSQINYLHSEQSLNFMDLK